MFYATSTSMAWLFLCLQSQWICVSSFKLHDPDPEAGTAQPGPDVVTCMSLSIPLLASLLSLRLEPDGYLQMWTLTQFKLA